MVDAHVDAQLKEFDLNSEASCTGLSQVSAQVTELVPGLHLGFNSNTVGVFSSSVMENGAKPLKVIAIKRRVTRSLEKLTIMMS